MPVCVIIVDYNGGAALERCLGSLAQQKGHVPEQVVFVDNCSASYDPIKIASLLGERFDERVSFVRLDRNYGYARGVNIGIEHALKRDPVQPWILTLTNDTELEAGFLEVVKREIEFSPEKVGMLAPKLRSAAEREVLDGAGIGLCLDGMSTAIGQGEVDRGQYDHSSPLIANGTAPVYRACMLSEIGLFDGDFWAYCEDTDLGLRAWLAGWSCKLMPSAIVYHARSTSLGDFSLTKLYYAERNHFWVAVKNYPWLLLCLNPIFTAFRMIFQIYALVSKKGQGDGFGRSQSVLTLAQTTLRAQCDALKGLRKMLGKRKQISKLRRRTSLEILRVLWSARLSFSDLILKKQP